MSSYKNFEKSGTVYRTQGGLSSSILHSSDQDPEFEESQDLSASVLQSSDKDPNDTKSNDLSASVLHSSEQDPDINEPHDLPASVLQSSEIDSIDSDTRDIEQAASDLPGDVAISSTDHCDACQNKAVSKILEAAWDCQECDERLCNECKSCHKAFRMTKCHTLASLQPPCEPCKKKRGEVAAAFYCNNCQELLCDGCKSSHETFKLLENHEIIPSREKIKKQQKIQTEETSGKTDNKDRSKSPNANQLEVSNSQSATKITNQDKTQEQQKTRDKPDLAKNTNADNVKAQTERAAINQAMVQTEQQEKTGHSNISRSMEEHTPNSLIQRLRKTIWPAKKKNKPNNVPFSQRTAKLLTEFDVKVPGDTKIPWITGSAFLRDSRLLLVDWRNKKLKLFDTNYKFVTDKEFSERPWEVSVYDSSEVAVTVLGSGIARLSVDGDVIREKGDISQPFDCYGVSFISSDKLAVTGEDRDEGILCVYTTAGRQLSRLSLGQGDDPDHITANRRKSRVYVSSFATHAVSAIDLDNKIVFTYKHKDLSHPGGVTVDKEHNLYVCGDKSHNIHQVSPDGEHIQILLSSKDGLSLPRTMSFSPSGDTFIVGSRRSQTVHVYTMQ